MSSIYSWAILMQDREIEVYSPALSYSSFSIFTSSQVVAAYSNGLCDSVFVISKDDVIDPGIPTADCAKFTAIAVSSNGKYLALYSSSKDDTGGRVWVVSANFRNNIVSVTVPDSTPEQLAWCGSDSVVASWFGPTQNLVFMMGPKGQNITFSGIFSRVHLLTEIDGMRFLSCEKNEFVQKVPSGTQEISQSSRSRCSINPYSTHPQDLAHTHTHTHAHSFSWFSDPLVPVVTSSTKPGNILTARTPMPRTSCVRLRTTRTTRTTMP